MDAVRAILKSDERGATRAIGGLVLAIGTLVLLFRRTAFADPWSDLVIFLIVAVLAKFLFWSGFWGARWAGRPAPWQTVFTVFGIVLVPFALFSFVEWVGGDTGAPLNVAWIFLLTALAAFLALFGARIRVGALLGALALLVSWLVLWEELLSGGLEGDIGTTRGLLLIAAAILLLVAAGVGMSGRAPEGSGADVVTAAGVAAVAAGAISLGAFQNLFVPEELAGGGTGIEANLFWDLELLVVAVVLLAFGWLPGPRGPAYVGAFGLIAFVYVVGLDLDDSSPAGKVVGWPLVLLLVGAALLAASAIPALSRLRE